MKNTTLLQMAQGFALIATALEAEALGVTSTIAEKQKEEKAPKKVAPVVETETEVDTDEEEGYTLAELKALKLPELKKLADDNGIEYGSKVKKDELIDLIMDEEDVEPEDEDEPGEIEEPEVGDEEEGTLTVEDLEDMTLKELKELADENEIEYAKGIKAPALRKIIAPFLEEEEEVEEEAEVEGDEEELKQEDLEDMTLKELKELATEYEIEFPKVVKAPKLREILIAELWAEDAEDADDSDETGLEATDYAEQLGLNDMDVEELTELLTSHKIKAKGKKEALIARVIQAIEEGVIEVEDEEGE